MCKLKCFFIIVIIILLFGFFIFSICLDDYHGGRLRRSEIWNRLELQGLPTPIFASDSDLLRLLQMYGK
jgi:hypothetical protein